ncbi:MAG: hypothetical protein AAF721_01635, partial [Myxococcota bacterium]
GVGGGASVPLGARGWVGKTTWGVGNAQRWAINDDTAAAWAAGASKVHLFSLDGMVELGDPDAWLSASVTDPGAAEPNPAVARARDAISVLDRLERAARPES